MKKLSSGSKLSTDELGMFKAVIDQLPVPVAKIEVKTGQIVLVNQACCDLLGYTEQDLLSKTAIEITDPDDRKTFSDILNRTNFKAQLQPPVEKRFVKKNGDLIWTRVEARFVGNERKYVAGIIHDITAEKTAYAALEESHKLVSQREQQLDLAASSGEVGVWDWDLVTNTVQMTPLQREIMGIPLDQLTITFNDFSERVLPEDREVVGQKVKLAFDGLQDYSAEFRIVRDGEIRWLTGRGRVIRGLNGEPLRLVGVNCDVTEFRIEARERDELIVREQAAITSSKMKSEFLANMSHELRTPLNGVLGLTGLLLDTPLDSEQKNYAQIIVKSADALLVLVNDILDLSKVEAGQLNIETLDFDLPSLVEDAIGALTFAAQEKSIVLINENKDVEYPMLRGDSARLRQVLNNLLSNAIKFSAGGHVSVALKKLVEAKDSVSLRFEVADTGIGLSPETIARLFRPFAQADTSTTRRFGGSGLGLSICKRLVELMDGTIGVSSELGIGSKFWFEIKFEKAQERNEIQQAYILPKMLEPGMRARILLVEDNIVNQKIALKQLEKLGHIPTAVDHGAAALEALSSNTFDLILMDCQMPVMDGYEATKSIRSLPNNRISQIPIIAMTAHAFTADRERCLAAGMSDYIAKPVKTPQLSQIINRWIDKKKAA